jgi:hypothetical protein
MEKEYTEAYLEHMRRIYNENTEDNMEFERLNPRVSWYILLINGVRITEDDIFGVVARVSQIIRENGLQWEV